MTKEAFQTSEDFDFIEFKFADSGRRVFRTKEKITVSQHTDAHRQVTRGPWKGQWNTTNTEYLRFPMDLMFFDEVDKYDPPINRLIREEADVLYRFQARCPMCGQYQFMEFDRIRWPKDIRDPKKVVRKKLARYVCERCENGWTDDHRDLAVRRGKWVPFTGKGIFGEFSDPPERPVAVALHLPSWYSPFISLSEVAAAFLRGLKDPNKLRIFQTQHKAEPWVYKVKTTTTDTVLKARVPELKPQIVPARAVALTCGIDVQKYGFWFLVRAWARDYTSWMIHYGWLTYWAELEDLLFAREYPREGAGPDLRIWRAGIDTGGGKYEEEISSAEQVYLWLLEDRIGRGCQVWGTKGASKSLAGKISVGKSLQHTPSGRTLPGGLQIVSLDMDKLKDIVHFRLEKAMAGAAETAHMAAYLHAGTKLDYARQIMSEVKKQDKKGRETWVQEYRENHLLDCEVIAHALADPEWPGGGVHLLSEPEPEPAATRKPSQPTDPRDRAAAIRERIRNNRR